MMLIYVKGSLEFVVWQILSFTSGPIEISLEVAGVYFYVSWIELVD